LKKNTQYFRYLSTFNLNLNLIAAGDRVFSITVTDSEGRYFCLKYDGEIRTFVVNLLKNSPDIWLW